MNGNWHEGKEAKDRMNGKSKRKHKNVGGEVKEEKRTKGKTVGKGTQ